MVGTPNRPPSSPTKTTTVSRRRGAMPRRLSSSMASNDATTPSAPSYAPPCTTESRWLPAATESGPGLPNHAQRLPFLSISLSRPSALHLSTYHLRACTSAAFHATRPSPQFGSSGRSSRARGECARSGWQWWSSVFANTDAECGWDTGRVITCRRSCDHWPSCRSLRAGFGFALAPYRRWHRGAPWREASVLHENRTRGRFP